MSDGSYYIKELANLLLESMLFQNYLLYPPDFPDNDIRAVSGALIHRLPVYKPIPSNKFADITYESEFNGFEIPKGSVIKMSKKKYIDDFFESGKLQLGTFKYYQNLESYEIGDKSEGSCILVGCNKNQTAFATISTGFDNYLFCCFDGKPSSKLIKKFGYNDFFEITDIEKFSLEIKKSLKAKSEMKLRCIYKKDKVLVGQTNENFNHMQISAELQNLVNRTQYFIKNSKYSHQNEFRFLWEIEGYVNDPLIIECKEAIKYCKRG